MRYAECEVSMLEGDCVLCAAQRERVMVVLRILLVIFVNLVSIPSYQSQMAQVQLAKAATFWMLSGAESLLIGSLGWQVHIVWIHVLKVFMATLHVFTCCAMVLHISVANSSLVVFKMAPSCCRSVSGFSFPCSLPAWQSQLGTSPPCALPATLR